MARCRREGAIRAPFPVGHDAFVSTQGPDDAATAEHVARLIQLPRGAGLPDFRQGPAAMAFLGAAFLGAAILAQATTLAFRDGFLVVTAMFAAALLPDWILHRATAQR